MYDLINDLCHFKFSHYTAEVFTFPNGISAFIMSVCMLRNSINHFLLHPIF